MKFGRIMQNGSPNELTIKNWIFSKYQDGGGRHFEKLLNRDISANRLTDFDEI